MLVIANSLEEGFGDRWRAGVVVAGHVADFGFDSGVVLVVLEDEADGECDGTLPPVELYSENGVLDGLGLEVGFDFAPEFDACGAGEDMFDETIIALLMVGLSIGLDYLCQAIFVGGMKRCSECHKHCCEYERCFCFHSSEVFIKNGFTV